MTVLGLSLILLVATAWTLMPLWHHSGEMPQEPADADELEARHRQLLLALQDLDFELQTGKLSPGDHQTMRGRLQGEAVAVLQQMEFGHGRTEGVSEPPAGRKE
jgi:hypothetical protein